jgi:hypothetical protein
MPINLNNYGMNIGVLFKNLKEKTPAELSLRNKDRYLWAKSFVKQLRVNIGQWEASIKKD